MKTFFESYDASTEPAILVPKAGHTRRIDSLTGVVSRSEVNPKAGLPFSNGRAVVACDIGELRRVYPDVPRDKLRQLIEMNKSMYPEVRK